MSQENVEIVRRAFSAYINQGGVDAAVDYYAEDCVIEDFPEMPESATYVGREGLRERDQHFGDMWEDWVVEPVEFIDGGDVVVAVIAMTGHGRGSGAPLDALAVFVMEIRDGKVVRDRAFTSKSEALEAVGLSE